MKTYQTLTFTTDQGADLKVDAYEGVTVSHVIGSHWDPNKNEEVQAATFQLNLTSQEARELAANLLKGADFSDEVEMKKPMSLHRGRRG